MTLRTFVLPKAQGEIKNAAVWYEDQEARLSECFVHELRDTLVQISENPRRFPIVTQKVRRALLHKFPYSIYFIAEADAITVIAVLHQHRQTIDLHGR